LFFSVFLITHPGDSFQSDHTIKKYKSIVLKQIFYCIKKINVFFVRMYVYERMWAV